MKEIYHNGLMSLLEYYAIEYKRDGKNFIGCYLKFKGIRCVCRAITKLLKKEIEEIDKDFSSYCEKFETDRETLNGILKLIYHITN